MTTHHSQMSQMSQMSQVLASPQRLKLMAVFQRDQPGSAEPFTTGVERIPRHTPNSPTGPVPLSCAQQRLWFLEQCQPGTAAYTIPVAFRLQGPLDIAALQRSLAKVVRRHEALRTRIILRADQPVQDVMAPDTDAAQVPLTVRDIAEWTGETGWQTSDSAGEGEAAYDEAVSRWLTAQARRHFDLSTGPLLRADLLRLHPGHPQVHVLLLTLHHLVADGWSIQNLCRELSLLYETYAGTGNRDEQRARVESGESGTSTGAPGTPPLPTLPVQYADYALWQHERLRETTLAAHLAYWRERLSGAPPLLNLPTDFARPPILTYQGAVLSFVVPPDVTVALKELSRRYEATLFMTLLAAFYVFLARHSGADDITVGTPIAGRVRPELENLIGCFVNTLALRADLGDDPPFCELLRHVRASCLAAYAHQEVPFERIVEALHPERALSHQPLTQVLFGFHSTPVAPLRLAGITVRPLPIDSGTAKFDLSLTFEESPQGLLGRLEYATDLFAAPTIARMAGHVQALLEGIVANPEQRIAALPLLTSQERQIVLEQWGQWEQGGTSWGERQREQRELIPAPCAHRVVEAQAARTPQAIAVVSDERQLTYHEVNARANQLARYLRRRDVGPDTLVGLCLERSCDMLVGLLGILKAGGAYLPLDPDFPPERLAYMLEDSHAAILVTQQSLMGRFPGRREQAVLLDTDWDRIARQSPQDQVQDQAYDVQPDHLAYVIYTSGSTGKPKGVQVEHRALTNLLSDMRIRLDLHDGDTWLAVTTLSFDIATLELLLPLQVGARVVIVSREVACDGGRLAEQLAAADATIMQATPVTWRMLLASGWEGKEDLCILSGGEALPRDVAHQLQLRSARVWNLYGPTETCIYSLAHCCDGGAGPVPIGRPIANTEAYVLDPHLQPVPVGVVGELYLGGMGLARGYLGRPELTRERFIPHPFRPEAGARLYRTGDLVRWRPDGQLDFLGRKDQQVKLRGYRIELGEIESVLTTYPGVRQAVVLVREDVPGDQRLVAYVVAKAKADVLDDTHPIDPHEVRRFMAARLPSYMIPAAIVMLDAFPVTPNGKVDRQVLPPPTPDDAACRDEGSTYVEPRTTLEVQLARLWEDVLQVRRIGAYDDFFALGGHSLQAAHLISLINRTLGCNLPLMALLQGKTVAGLASAVREHQEAARESLPLVTIQRGSSRWPLFVVHAAGGHLIRYVDLARAMGAEQTVFGLQAPDDRQMAPYRVEEMATYYVEALRTIQPYGPYFLAGFSSGGFLIYEIAQQLCDSGHEVALLALLDTGNVRDGWPPCGADDAAIWCWMYGHEVALSVEQLRSLTPLEQVDYVIAQLRTSGQLHSRLTHLGTAELRRFFQILKSNTQAMVNYLPRPYANRLTLVRAATQPPAYALDETLGWESIAMGGIDIYPAPGDHYTLLLRPQIESVAAIMREVVTAASQERIQTVNKPCAQQ